MKPYFVLVGILLAGLGNAQADTFRWVDKSGKVHYGDVPTEEAAQIEPKKFSAAPAAEDVDLPYATRLAHQNFPVTLYTFGNCGDPCPQARNFLNKRGVPFSEKSLVSKEDFDAFKLKSGSDTLPTLSVGKAWLKNFEAGQWNAELDVAGYPKTSPYRPVQESAKPSTEKSKPGK